MSVFTMIIDGDLPGRFVWKDDRCVAFLSINPLSPGHTLVVPRDEVDHWLELDDDLVAHLMLVSKRVGQAINDVFAPGRVCQAIVGFEVPHVHLHVYGADSMGQVGFENAQAEPDPAMLDDAAERIRAALQAAGHAEASA